MIQILNVSQRKFYLWRTYDAISSTELAPSTRSGSWMVSAAASNLSHFFPMMATLHMTHPCAPTPHTPHKTRTRTHHEHTKIHCQWHGSCSAWYTIL